MFVILLNYLPWIILAAIAFIVYSLRNTKTKRAQKIAAAIVLGLISILATNVILARYTPAADTSVIALEAPQFETVEAPLKNELSKPNPNNEKILAEGTDWRKDVEANKESRNEKAGK